MTAPADFYAGLVAQAYTALRSQIFDPAPYAAFVRSYGEPGLEVGCGAGDPLLHLVQDGLEVHGADSSADMIDQARTTAEQRELDMRLHVTQMEDMDLDQQYRSIYLAGPTFELLPDDAAALRALTSFRRHLATDGAVMVPLWIASPTPKEQFHVAREAVDGCGAVVRFTPMAEEYDPLSRTRRTAVTYERIPQNGPTEVVHREWLIHWQTRETITALATQADLKVLSVEPPSTDGADEPGDEFTAVLAPA